MTEPTPTLPPPQPESIRARCPKCGAEVVSEDRWYSRCRRYQTFWICLRAVRGEGCDWEEPL